MEIERKLSALEAVYAVYDEFLQTQPSACGMRCTDCCTTRVTLTTLEAYRIWTEQGDSASATLGDAARAAGAVPCVRPALTVNAVAALCAAGGDPSAEESGPMTDACPLLRQGLCAIYALRPFHCRCFVSRTRCGEAGAADVTEFLVAVNTVFLQTIEHLDADGCSGSLLDLLKIFSAGEKRAAYAAGVLHCSGNGLIANTPLTVLMVPPEHRARIEPILRKLREIRI